MNAGYIWLPDASGISKWTIETAGRAIQPGCEILWTENLSEGQQFGPVAVRNPFRG